MTYLIGWAIILNHTIIFSNSVNVFIDLCIRNLELSLNFDKSMHDSHKAKNKSKTKNYVSKISTICLKWLCKNVRTSLQIQKCDSTG